MKEIPTEVYSRVSGYFRPTRQWNKGKKSEFEERKYMRIPEGVGYSASTRNFNTREENG